MPPSSLSFFLLFFSMIGGEFWPNLRQVIGKEAKVFSTKKVDNF